MRRRSVVTALVVLTASAALRRLARHRSATARIPVARAAAPVATEAAPVQAAPVAPPVTVPAGQEAVVLPFARRAAAAPAPEQPAAPVRCGDTGGRTRAGAPCAARAGDGGRCHHHRVAA
jgi:hypothetical protein